MKVFDNKHVQLHQSNASELPVDDESIDCVVTSPPYWGLRDYGVDEQIGLESTPEKYVENMVNVFREIKRVLKSSGTVWLNLGDSYIGTGHKGNYTDPKYKEGRNGQTVAINNKVAGYKSKDLAGIPWMVAFALRADGWYLRSDIIWNKPNPMPEPVKDRPTKSHEYIFLLTKSPTYYYDAHAIREPLDTPLHKPGNKTAYGVVMRTDFGTDAMDRVWGNPAGRNKRSVWTVNTHPYPDAHFATFPEKLVEPCILAGTSEKGVCARCGKPWEKDIIRNNPSKFASDSNIRNFNNDGKTSNPQSSKSLHRNGSGVYSTAVVRGWQPTCECNADIVPATVLDPFVGSGTTLAVAQRLGRNGIGTDISSEYLELASKRLEKVALPMLLNI